MLHITIGIVENYEGLQVKASKKFATGSSDRSLIIRQADYQDQVDKQSYILKRIADVTEDLIK